MWWFQEYGDFFAVFKIKNFSKFWINLVDEALSAQVSFGSYLNSLFKTTIVSFILQFLTHNSPEHGCDALNCTLWLMWVMLLWFCSQFCKWIGWVGLVIDVGASWDDCITYFENVVRERPERMSYVCVLRYLGMSRKNGHSPKKIGRPLWTFPKTAHI